MTVTSTRNTIMVRLIDFVLIYTKSFSWERKFLDPSYLALFSIRQSRASDTVQTCLGRHIIYMASRKDSPGSLWWRQWYWKWGWQRRSSHQRMTSFFSLIKLALIRIFFFGCPLTVFYASCLFSSIVRRSSSQLLEMQKTQRKPLQRRPPIQWWPFRQKLQQPLTRLWDCLLQYQSEGD